MSKLPTDGAEFNLQQVLVLMNYLSQWLVRSGVGYTEFTAALKPIFYQQAFNELQRIDQKTTISALSLLSGLHRKDVTAYKEVSAAGMALTEATVSEPVSVPSRVIGLWIAEGWKECLPFHSETENSFEHLVKRVSTERHPRSVLNELVRLGVVLEENEHILLQKGQFIPDPSLQEARKILTNNLQSHMAAGLHNIFQPDQISYLEQAICADELTEESINILHDQSLKLWQEYSLQLLKLASERCALDEGKEDAKKSFRFGVYQHDSE
jgi:hypothetical protein